jgi:hypothetical protein
MSRDFDKNRYFSLLSSYDCLGWVPTICGGLSLHVLDRSTLWGDVDKYVVNFQIENGYDSSNYLIAISLLTFDDQKTGFENSRTFRFLFYGTINDPSSLSLLKEDNAIDDVAAEKMELKTLLIGKLVLITHVSPDLTENTNQILKDVIKITELKEALDKDETLAKKDTKKAIIGQWNNTQQTIKKIESETINYELKEKTKEAPIFIFNCVLTKDGILFLKNMTIDKYKQCYKGDDFSQIQLPQIYKTALNYIKFMFHQNYHHDKTHDNFLPVINLHYVNAIKDLNIIVDNQIDSFMEPVTVIKRKGKDKTVCDPAGILIYADSFLEIFDHKGFINPDKTIRLRKFISNQKVQYDVLFSKKSALYNTFATQTSAFVTITVAIASTVAMNRIFAFIFQLV